jgi:hypothetical protein
MYLPTVNPTWQHVLEPLAVTETHGKLYQEGNAYARLVNSARIRRRKTGPGS